MELKEQKDINRYILKGLKTQYDISKHNAGNFIKHNLQITSDLLGSLKKLANVDGLIEVGNAYGDGDDGSGYYKCSLVLNLNNFEKGDTDNIIYLVVMYVPIPDNGHDWDIKEFSEISECNFVKALVLLTYMQVFLRKEGCSQELHRLAERKYSTCVKTVESGGLSFF